MVMGARIGELGSLGILLTFEFLITLLWSFILLKYYRFKGYRFASVTLIATLLASFLFLISLKLNNTLATRQLSDFVMLAILASLITGVIYSCGLIVSRTGERPLLKVAGIILLLQGLIVLSSTLWAFNSTTFMQGGNLARVEHWASWLSIFAYGLFALNFVRERENATDSNEMGGKTWITVMGFLAFATLIYGLVFGMRLAAESMALLRGPQRIYQNQKKLAQPFEVRTYSNMRGEQLPFRLLKPLDYDSTKKYPLVVCLHGSSGCGNDNIKQVAASLTAQLLSEPKNRMKYPAFLLVPQCPHEKSWGGIPGLPAVDSLVIETIQTLVQELPIDVDRLYLTGNSLGGYGVWFIINKWPGIFAAAIPISGGGNPQFTRHPRYVPIWAFHGAKDRNVPISGSRKMIDALKNLGLNPLYTEYPDAAHDIGELVKTTPDLLDWLFAQNLKKQMSPNDTMLLNHSDKNVRGGINKETYHQRGKDGLPPINKLFYTF